MTRCLAYLAIQIAVVFFFVTGSGAVSAIVTIRTESALIEARTLTTVVADAWRGAGMMGDGGARRASGDGPTRGAPADGVIGVGGSSEIVRPLGHVLSRECKRTIVDVISRLAAIIAHHVTAGF